MIVPDIQLEKSLWRKGIKYVVGLDEAGRGPLAGPVCAGAVVIDSSTQLLPTVRDSKKMSIKKREVVFDEIKSTCLAWGIGMVSAKEIDRVGIQKAVRVAMQQALAQVEKMLKSRVDYLIVDGTNVSTIIGYNMEKIKGGDMKHYSISAASILAKVERDRYMREIANRYPDYCFEKHVGYGTKLHMELLKKFGPTDIHRRSFAPIKDWF
ncbi:MAG: ribonuclease HII [Candidatus Dojkabacteria bacterium]